MKNFFILLTLLFIGARNSYAQPIKNIIQKEIKPTITTVREQIRNKIREELNQASTPAQRNEIRKEIREENKGLLDQIKNQIKEKLQNLRFSARFSGKIVEKEDNFIKVEVKDEKVYQVNINEKTQLRRRFWGDSNLSEFSVGDEVNVIGRYANEEKTVIEAVLIRNLFLQRRWGVFFGQVSSKAGDSFVIETVNRGKLTVYFGSAKFLNRKGETISYNDIQVGHRVRVKGVWDKTLSKIIELEEVKDFSLPPLPTKTVSPTQTP